MIPRGLYERYRTALAQLNELAVAESEAILARSAMFGGAEPVEQTLAALNEVKNTYGDMAMAAANEFYTAQRDANGVKRPWTPTMADRIPSTWVLEVLKDA